MKKRQFIIRTCMLMLLTGMAAFANAANLTHELGNYVTVTWYSDQDKVNAITTVTLEATTQTIYVDIQPAVGYWTDVSLLGIEKIGSPGAAGARMKRSPSMGGYGEIATIQGGSYALNGAGLYKVTVPALAAGQTADQIAEICLIGTINACTSISGATITATSKTYSGSNQTASTISVALGETDLTVGTDYTVTTNEGGTDVGNYPVVITGIGRYTGTATNSTAFAITLAANSFTTQPTITGWTYGADANAPTGGVAAFGTIVYKYCATADGEYGTYDAVVNDQAGDWYVKGFVEATPNYAAAESNAIAFTIANAAMTGITATAYNAAYDGSAHGITLNGVPTGATIKYRLTDSGDYELTENPTLTNVGTQTVYYKVSQTNYDDVTGNSTVTITQAANSFTTQPTITGWTFGESANDPTGGEANFGTSTITYKYGNAADGTYDTYANVVNGQAGIWYVKGFVEATTNYAAAESNAIAFTIANATMTGITATAYNAVYDGSAHGITLNNVPVGATVTYGETAGNYDLTANPTYTDVAPARTVYYKVSKTNYSDVTGSQTVIISKAALSVTAKPKTITYGDAPANDGVEYSGFATGESASNLGGELSYAYSYAQYDDVGNTYTITPSGYTSTNYEITYNTGILTVVQKEVGLTWSDISLTYTGSAQAPTATATGTVNNDEIGVTVTGGQTDAGTGYTATASALTGAKSANYKLPDENTTTFSISSAAITGVTVGGYNSAYDGTAHGITVSAPEGTTIKYGTTEGNYDFDDNPTYTAAGNYPVYYQITKDNYTTVTGSQTVIISKAALSVTAKPKTITFGDAPANDGVTYSGFVNGESETVLGGTLAYDYNYAQNYNVGTYTITPKGLTSGNYNITFVAGTLTVNAKVIEENTDGTGVTQDEHGYTVTVTETVDNTSAEIIDLSDNSNVYSLTYSRTLSYPTGEGDTKIDNEATNLYTICLPYTPTPTDRMKFYELTGVSGSSLVFNEVSTPAANTPYMVAVSGTANITIAPDAISNLALKEVITGSTVDGYTMMGTHTGLSNSKARSLVGEGNFAYILQSNNRWGKMVEGSIYLPPFRAFIQGPAVANGARLTGSFDGDATGINSLRLVGHDGTEQWYDLNGRRIERPTKKGLYIYQGKKVTIK